MRKKFILPLLVLALLATIVAARWLVGRLPGEAAATANPDPECDLQRSPCGAALPGGGRAVLSIAPRPIPLLKPLTLDVQMEGPAANGVAVTFSGVDMDMGQQRTTLAAVGPGRFRGEATLPICVTGRMQWQATVSFDRGGQRIAIPFRFFAPQ